MSKITLRVKEHYDEDIVLDFPEGWKVDVLKMNNHDAQALKKKQIDDALVHPIGTKSISELAKGKRGRIAIVHDDLTRPTPAYQIVPSIIDELHVAGIHDSQIFFLAALGSHPAMTVEEFGRKIGFDTIQKYDIRNHVALDSRKFGTHNFVDKGFTSLGTPVSVNRAFAQADLRIGISGLKKYGGGIGSGGGGKICMPGIASLEAIAYNHTQMGYLRDRPKEGWSYWNFKSFRRDMQEFARMAGLDFSINVVPNGRREAAAVFAGDLDDAFFTGVKSCYEAHSTKIPSQKYDVVLACSYPQADAEGLSWSETADIIREGGTVVNVCLHTRGHYLTHFVDEVVRGAMLKFLAQDKAKQWPIKEAGHIIILNNLMDMHERMQFDERVEFLGDWPSVLARLRKIHGDHASVAVFPIAVYQFNPKKHPLVL